MGPVWAEEMPVWAVWWRVSEAVWVAEGPVWAEETPVWAGWLTECAVCPAVDLQNLVEFHQCLMWAVEVPVWAVEQSLVEAV